MYKQLKTLQPSRALPRPALATVQRHASWLRLAAQRTLKRRNAPLHREMFLVEGVVATRSGRGGAEKLDAAALGGYSLNSCVAEANEISTVTPAALIVVDLASIRSVLNGAAPTAPAVGDVDDWMGALLQGPIMRWFSPGAWARVLRVGKPRNFRAGDRILRQGEVSGHVFVVAQGAARSASAHYPPGAFFGEESALGLRPAAEEVVMEDDGVVVCFKRADVVAMAADYSPPRMNPPPRRLDLDNLPAAEEQRLLTTLDPVPPIAVRASDPARRLRVAASLMRRGFTVV